MKLPAELNRHLAFIDELRARGVAYCKVEGLEVNLFPDFLPQDAAEPLQDDELKDPVPRKTNPLAEPISGWGGFSNEDLFGGEV